MSNAVYNYVAYKHVIDMVVQRGTSTWTVGSAGTQQQHQQAQQQSPHFMKHGQDYDTNSVRASSVVVTDSSALRCNVVVPSPAPLVDSQTQVEWVCTPEISIFVKPKLQ